MYYYRQVIDGQTVGYQACELSCESEILAQITEDEYVAEIAKLQENLPQEETADERIAKLEAENSALRNQLKTVKALSQKV